MQKNHFYKGILNLDAPDPTKAPGDATLAYSKHTKIGQELLKIQYLREWLQQNHHRTTPTIKLQTNFYQRITLEIKQKIRNKTTKKGEKRQK